MDALTLSFELKEGRITALDVMIHTLRRIDDINARLNAVVSLRDRTDLLDEARRADDEIRAGKKRRGWLHGIPLAVKDLSDVSGIRTTMGSTLMESAPPISCEYEETPFVRRLRRSGAIIIGKTNTPEFGLGSHTYNPVFGRTSNPFDADKSAGGSSGGAGAAVASGMVSCADGTDMMGSLRNPAGWNGLYSLRPTAGLMDEADAREEMEKSANASAAVVDVTDEEDAEEGTEEGQKNGGASSWEELPHPISTAGPIGRTPRDCAALLRTMIGSDGDGDGDSSNNLDLFDASKVLSVSRPSLPSSLKGKRVGWLSTWGGSYPTEPAVLERCEDALRILESAGAAVVRVEDPPFSSVDMWDSWTAIRSKVVADGIADRFGDDFLEEYDDTQIKPELRYEVERGLSLSADRWNDAVRIMKEWSARAEEELFTNTTNNDGESGECYDLMALPSAQLLPFPVEWTWPRSIHGTEMDSYHRWMECHVPVSLGGLPCATVPAPSREAGRDGGGKGECEGGDGDGDGNENGNGDGDGDGRKGELPIGLQLFGPRGSDAEVLSAAAAYYLALAEERREEGGGRPRPPDF